MANIKKRILLNRSRRNVKKNHVRKVTVGEWVQYWYETYKSSKHADTTRQVQGTYINCHIRPHIGELYVHLTKASDIQVFLNYLQREGNQSRLKHTNAKGKPLASWTVKKIRALLIAAFDAAIKEKLIAENPARNTDPITVQTLKVAYFTPLQQKKFLFGTQKHRFYLAYQLLFNTGCRRSEILGLSWDSIDFELNQIHVRKVLVNINGLPVLKNYPKTKSSVRTIPIHAQLTKMLKDHRNKQNIEANAAGENWNNTYNLVFTNRDGSPHSPTYFLHNFKNAIRKLGLPANLRVHSTRHTFATNLLQLGVSIADVQALGGWADTRVVLDIYSHTVKESHRDAVQKLYNQSNSQASKKVKNG